MSRIYKRGNIWYIDFEYKGKRRRKSLDTRSKQVAELALKDIDVKVATQKLKLAPPEKIGFNKFAVKFLEWYKIQNSWNSYRDYRNLFNSTIIPFFSNRKLTDISVEMIEKYKFERSKSISPSTVNKELIALRHIFNKAILWGYLDRNPSLEVDKLRVKQRKFRFLSLDEIYKIFEVCPDNYMPIFLTAIHTGIRKSELFRLEWNDIDFERQYIVVSNKEEAHTKNYRIREIPMTNKLTTTLKELFEKSKGKDSYIFLKPDGSRHMGEIRSALRKIIKLAKIKPFTLHDLRHTFASHLVMDGIDLPTVQKLMGHSSINTTMIYAHLAPDHLKSAIHRLNIRLNHQ